MWMVHGTLVIYAAKVFVTGDWVETEHYYLFLVQGPVCVDPGYPADGDIKIDSVEEGTIAAFTCKRTGFKPFPSSSIKCILGNFFSFINVMDKMKRNHIVSVCSKQNRFKSVFCINFCSVLSKACTRFP